MILIINVDVFRRLLGVSTCGGFGDPTHECQGSQRGHLSHEISVEPLRPCPAQVLLVFLFRHLQFLHLLGQRLVLPDHVEVVGVPIPLVECEIGWVQPDDTLVFAFDFNFKGKDDSRVLVKTDFCNAL